MIGDDAASGARGPRPTCRPWLMELLADEYGITPAVPPSDLGGSANLNLLVDATEGRFVVRVYRRHVTPARLTAIQLARRALVEAAIPAPRTVATRRGAGWVRVGVRLVEVERFVHSDGCMDSWGRLLAGMPWLGRTHTALATVPIEDAGMTSVFVNHIGAEEVVAATRQGTDRVRGWRPSAAELRLADAADELAERVEAGERRFGDLAAQLVHGDFWDDNVLFRGETLVLVTDLEMLGRRPRIDDLALTLYFAGSSLSGDQPESLQLARVRRLVDAYDAGLGEPLTTTERLAIPLALARQPLWGIGRWVALLDDEDTARHHCLSLVGDVHRALQLLRNLDTWQARLRPQPPAPPMREAPGP